MGKTKIPWVIAPDGSRGETLNILTGCFGPGGTPEKPNRCPWCFAWRLAETRLRDRYLANPNVIAGDPADPFAPRWWPGRWQELVAMRQKTARGIFLVDMGDMFGDWVPKHYIEMILTECWHHPNCRFYVLTKNPSRLSEFNPWPPNVWVGATATDWTTCVAALSTLGEVEATVKYLSLEPLLGPAALPPIERGLVKVGISWLIIGPCTGKLAPAYPCNREWVAYFEGDANVAGIPVFEKGFTPRFLGRPLRQEFPQ